MSIRYLIGDVFDRMAQLEDGSVDLVLTSPPFLALRSYLPADHPDKDKEIGSEATPAEFIDVLLRLTAEWRRLLAPHGSLVVELGDTYSGSGGAGGDYGDKGWRDGQLTFEQQQAVLPKTERGPKLSDRLHNATTGNKNRDKRPGWPLDKSLTLTPESYRFALAYGLNPHTGQPSPAGQWRVRNVIRWVRPNPPVGALGDKFRPATSELVVACVSKDRWFDLDTVREPYKYPEQIRAALHTFKDKDNLDNDKGREQGGLGEFRAADSAGAPPLDWWKISPKGYSGKTATTVKQVVDPGEFSGDMNRTTSEDCPMHAGLPGQLPKAQRDALQDGVQSSHNPDTSARPVQGQLLDSSPTDHSDELTTVERSSDSHDPEYVSAATPHNKASRKTDLVPSTNSSDTPSEKTSDHTGRTPTAPSSDGHHPDTPENKTSVDGLSSHEPGTDVDIGRISGRLEACTCTYFIWDTNYTSHYAVWPSELCVKPIKAMCPREVCRQCGEPRRRIVDVEPSPNSGNWYHQGQDGGSPTGGTIRTVRKTSTLGWSDCGHDNYRPGLVLDPFAGTGTTLAVAHGHSRDAIGIDIDERSAELARDRVGPLFLEVEYV